MNFNLTLQIICFSPYKYRHFGNRIQLPHVNMIQLSQVFVF